MDHNDSRLGAYLKERRARLDPGDFGFPLERRRTRGLRREEVAQLARISATWYTWLEQGRGGAPSADVLDRLATALALRDDEREHLFLLAQERPPKPSRGDVEVSGRLQRILDSLADSPAILKTPEWTVVAWNAAAAAVLADYGSLSESERNVLRLLFLRQKLDRLEDWESVARSVVGTFRYDITRAGIRPESEALIAELSRDSEAFRRIWADQDVQVHGEGLKRLNHPDAGAIQLEYSTFSVSGRPNLALVVFNPATEADRDAVRRLVADRAAGAS